MNRSIPPRDHRLNKDVHLSLALRQIIIIINCTKRKVKNHVSLDSRNEFKKILVEIQRKEIKRPEALDIKEFAALHVGIALQNLNQFCHISFRQGDSSFTSQAWNKLFRIQEQVFREYVMEFLSSFTFRDSIMDLDNAEGYKKKSSIVVAQLIGRISTSFGLMALGALKGVTLGPKTSLLGVDKLVELGICKYDVLGYGEMVDDVLEVAGDEEARAGIEQANVGDIPDLGVQQGVNFMSSTPIYSIAPSPSPNPFGLFGDANVGPSTTRSQQDDMNKY
nr:hypothetical protein [Tanacetum cinerariifolium]